MALLHTKSVKRNKVDKARRKVCGVQSEEREVGEEGGPTTKARTKHGIGTNLDPPFREATSALHNTLSKM